MKLADFKNPAIVSGEKELRAEELRLHVEGRAAELKKVGVAPGASVVLAKGNELDFFLDLFALRELGACAVPVSPAATKEELAKIAAHSGASLKLHAGGHEPLEPAQAPPAAGTALLLYTSGSTGAPKGVALSGEAVLRKLGAITSRVPAGDFRESLCLIPVSFGHGLIGNSLAPLFAGGRLRLEPAFSSDLLPNLGPYVDRHGITFLSSVPSLWSAVLPFSKRPAGGTLRRVYCASARLTTARWREVREWLGPGPEWKHVYGITELGSWFCAPADGAPYEEGLAGEPWDAEVRLDPASGEVLVRAPYVMSGYHGDPAGTKAAFADGFFRTGDLGELRADGQLRLTGRLKDLIHRGGLKVSPAEVEARLLAHGKVAEACVFSAPDDISGEAVCAAIVLRAGEQAAARELRAFCRETLSEFKVPERFVFLAGLPRNERGKVSLGELRALVAKGGA